MIVSTAVALSSVGRWPDTFFALLLTTFTVDVNVPVALGLPVTTPLDLRRSPLGSFPEANDHLYGGFPPLAASFVEYGTFTVPPANERLVTYSGDTTNGIEMV